MASEHETAEDYRDALKKEREGERRDKSDAPQSEPEPVRPGESEAPE